MTPVHASQDVFEAIDLAKANAPAFCTNFFPVPAKLQTWIERGELFVSVQGRAAFFFRRDRDFWHFYFSAANPVALREGCASLFSLRQQPAVTDVVGSRDSGRELLQILESAGFRNYAQLVRMMRPGGTVPSRSGPSPIAFAERGESKAIQELIERTFDRYAEQLPFDCEIDAAVARHQVLVARHKGLLGGLLFFESQGLASSVRFWVVDKSFRTARLGSALMSRYLESQSAVRRFTLWVMASNQDAIAKYRHYGYAPDGVVDNILANDMIRP